MSNEISNTGKNVIYSLYSDDTFIVLITITHPLIATRRYAGWPTQITSNGETYDPAGFALELPTDQDGRVKSTRLRFVNVSGELTPVLRSITDSPNLGIQLVLASDPDVVEIDYGNTYILRKTDITPTLAVGSFSQDALDNRQFGFRFTPEKAPSIHTIQR